jgi:hypothetical protein
VANAYSIAGARPEGYANTLDGEDMLNWWQGNAGGDVAERRAASRHRRSTAMVSNYGSLLPCVPAFALAPIDRTYNRSV